MMTLKRFRVTNFRSIMDSGWIENDDVTTLVGINEAGKSNVILALWKLKPVRDGEIDILHDMPTKEYTSWRTIPEQIEFISAEFELDSDLISQVVSLCDCERDAASLVRITRKYDGKYYVSFPSFIKVDHIDKSIVEKLVDGRIPSNDIHRLPAQEVHQTPLYLRRTSGHIGTERLCFLFILHQQGAAVRTIIREMGERDIRGSLIQFYSSDLRNDFSTFLHIDIITDMNVQKLHLVSIMQ